MRKEIQTILIISLLLLVIFGGYWIISKIRFKPQPQPTPIIQFPKTTTTTFITTQPTTSQPTTSIFAPVSKPAEAPSVLGKISKYEPTKYGDQYYLLVPKDGINKGTKLYMPFNGSVEYYKIDAANLNLQIYSTDRKIVLTLIGALKPLCKVSSTQKADVFEGKSYLCNNLKQGALIAETNEPMQYQDVALQITGFLSNKSSQDLLYQYLPLIAK